MEKRRETTQSLSSRLGALQDQMMDIYEKGGRGLEVPLMYWALQRKEHALLYLARQNGYDKLGLQPVPALAVSKAKATQAISMHLLLCSLQDSEYGQEPWSLSDTSVELYESKPQKTFKKHGATVRVHYDNSAENAMEYVCWGKVYSWDFCSSKWTCCTCGVDERGVYVNKKDKKQYYENFEKDSVTYGKTGTWTVQFKNKTFCCSTSSSVGEPVPTASHDAPDGGAPCDPNSPQKAKAPFSGKRKHNGPSVHGSEASGPLLGGQGERGPSPKRHKPASDGERTLRQPTHAAHPTGTPVSLHVQQQQQQHQQQQLQQQQLQQLQQQQLQQQQQRRPQEAEDRHQPRADLPRRDPLHPASTPVPVIVLSGSPNQLKCYRYRLNKKHKCLIKFVSTTWYWTNEGGQGEKAMITLMFYSEACKNTFLNSVVLPKGVTSTGGFLSL
ncbi:E2 [Ursus maritimus papillomavirus 1]|uniref:Regulatory protein E2 n=1 Tax=Ursus maritimus papillomavirus 1 TaxID=461322 RepID=B2KKW9_9PAPI|nr:E2 [Ursus maritimus papillomavirus 1]ABV80247.1 E2 [Ursus maritimus papillomavirus 1]